MRSRSSIKTTVASLAVLSGLSFSSTAQANIFSNFMKLFNGVHNSQNAPTAAVPVANAPQSPEVFLEEELIKKSFTFIAGRMAAKNGDLRQSATAVSEKVALVNTATHTDIVAEYSESGLKLKFLYDDVALKHPQWLLKDLATLDFIMNNAAGNRFNDPLSSYAFISTSQSPMRAELHSPHAVAELLTNVRLGSPTAAARWNDLQIAILSESSLGTEFAQKLQVSDNVLLNIAEELKSQKASLDQKALQFYRQQQKAIDTWRGETKALDLYEAQAEKLNDLILRNDRAGVRRLLEAYLPWSVMEPVEAHTWKIWLDAIENPDWKNVTVGLRGLNYRTDKVQRLKLPQGGEALGFMSTVLTQNQGSYTRRLRSLSTNRIKNGDSGYKADTPTLPTVKITDQMTAHARNPVASSFISFTYSARTAQKFMNAATDTNAKGEAVPKGAIMGVMMDKRRLFPNISSMYGGEIELLAPLIVFPDEVVFFHEGPLKDSDLINLIEEMKKKTGINLGNTEEQRRLYRQYQDTGHLFLKEIMAVESTMKSCGKVFN